MTLGDTTYNFVNEPPELPVSIPHETNKAIVRGGPSVFASYKIPGAKPGFHLPDYNNLPPGIALGFPPPPMQIPPHMAHLVKVVDMPKPRWLDGVESEKGEEEQQQQQQQQQEADAEEHS